MSCYVVIRRARADDEAARAALLWESAHEHFLDAFLMFYFNELTLQCVVLTGAVLFIWAGAGVAALGLVPAAAAALVAGGVWAAHALGAGRAARALHGELAGWVAEARAPAGEPLAPPRAPRLMSEEAARRADCGGEHTRVVGTVSLSEWWGAEPRGWLHALAVARGWRRRGAARALAGAAVSAAAAAGLHSVEAAASGVQAAGRAALQASGWALRGTYRRPLLGAALTLPMAQLGRDLPVP